MDFPKIYENGILRESFAPVIIISLLCHALFFTGIIYLSKAIYKSKEFDRPQTFQLIRLSALFETPVPPAAKTVPRPKTITPAPPIAQPQPVAPATEQTPVPATKKESAPQPQEAIQTTPSQQATGAVTGTQTQGEQPDPNKVYDEGATDEHAVPIKRPDPFYPEFVLEQGISGVVRALVTIDKDGTISSYKILSSPHELLSEEFIKALTRYKFKPAKVKGVAVKQKGIIEFDYKL